jgi:hypothetical protein
MKRSLNKISEEENSNASMKEFAVLKTAKQMIELMIMKTMIAGRNTSDVDCNEMGKFNKDDSDDSQSAEEACVDDQICSLH